MKYILYEGAIQMVAEKYQYIRVESGELKMKE